jgi:hypothetical protein
MDTAKLVQKKNQPEIITDTSMHHQVATTKEKHSEHFTNFQIKKMDQAYSTQGTTNTYSSKVTITS